MIVVMKPGSTQKQVEHVVKLVREMGLKEHVIVGTERTVVAVIGNDRFKDRTVLETVDGVDKVVPILAPYKMASKESEEGAVGRAAGRRRWAAKIGGQEGRRHRRAVQRGEQDAAAGDRPRGEGGRRGRACAAGRSSRGRIPTRSRDWRRRGWNCWRWRGRRRGWRWSRK